MSRSQRGRRTGSIKPPPALLVLVFLVAAGQISWTGPAISASDPVPDPAAALQAGDAALAAFDLPAALESFRAAYQLDPRNHVGARKLARALADTATLERSNRRKTELLLEAEQIARRAVQLQPQDAAAHTTLAIVVGKLALFEGGKRKVTLSAEVKEHATLALQLNPRDHLAYHVLGVWHREMAQLNWFLRKFAEMLYGKLPPASLDNAVAYLQRATELSPDNVSHLLELGETYIATRNWSAADTALTRALDAPQGWVTDDHYRARARDLQRIVQPRVR